MTSVAFSFHVSGKWEFAWKQDTNAETDKQKMPQMGRNGLTWCPGGEQSI